MNAPRSIRLALPLVALPLVALPLVTLAPLPAGASDVAAAKQPKQTAATAKHAPAATHAMAVPFLEDDYTKALAEARARKVPIFIEAWAPW